MQNTVLGFLHAIHENSELLLGNKTFDYFSKLLKIDLDKDGVKSLFQE